MVKPLIKLQKLCYEMEKCQTLMFSYGLELGTRIMSYELEKDLKR